MIDRTTKRLSPDARKAELLSAATALLAREGLEGFSLEAVAREAGVALSLPRHYFGSYRDLLKAATEDLLRLVEKTLLSHEIKLDLKSRVVAYMDLLESNPWGHDVWMRSASIHPEVDAIVRGARRRMSESMYRKPWHDLSAQEKLDARGRIGYIEAVISDWLESMIDSREVVAELVAHTISMQAKK